ARYVEMQESAHVSETSAFEAQSSKFKIRLWYCLSLALFVLGLMSKPMLVTLPFVMLLLDYWPLGRLAGTRKPSVSHFDWSAVWPLVREEAPFFILTAASCAVAV